MAKKKTEQKQNKTAKTKAKTKAEKNEIKEQFFFDETKEKQTSSFLPLYKKKKSNIRKKKEE